MRLLLDSHALLWFYLGDAQLSPTARAAIEDPNNAKAVSPASYWEIAIKLRLGKYQLTETYDEFIQHAIWWWRGVIEWRNRTRTRPRTYYDQKLAAAGGIVTLEVAAS